MPLRPSSSSFPLPYFPLCSLIHRCLCSSVSARLVSLSQSPRLCLFVSTRHRPQVGRTFDPATAFVVDDLKPNTEYAFRLAARSPQGLGAFTSVVRQRTLQSSRCLADPALLCGAPPPPAHADLGRDAAAGGGGAWPRACAPTRRRRLPQAPLCPSPWGTRFTPRSGAAAHCTSLSSSRPAPGAPGTAALCSGGPCEAVPAHTPSFPESPAHRDQTPPQMALPPRPGPPLPGAGAGGQGVRAPGALESLELFAVVAFWPELCSRQLALGPAGVPASALLACSELRAWTGPRSRCPSASPSPSAPPPRSPSPAVASAAVALLPSPPPSQSVAEHHPRPCSGSSLGVQTFQSPPPGVCAQGVTGQSRVTAAWAWGSEPLRTRGLGDAAPLPPSPPRPPSLLPPPACRAERSAAHRRLGVFVREAISEGVLWLGRPRERPAQVPRR